VRSIGLPILEYLEGRRDDEQATEDYVFPGGEDDTPFGSFPRQWTKILAKTDLAGITPHVLRHSFASIANDLGFTEATTAALVGLTRNGDQPLHPHCRHLTYHGSRQHRWLHTGPAGRCGLHSHRQCVGPGFQKAGAR